MTLIDFSKYQEAARKTRIATNGDPLTYTTLGLTGEAGEVANKVKKLLRNDGNRDEIIAGIKSEMGDLLWYLSAMADDLGTTLGEIAEINLEKLRTRYAQGKIQGNGDSR